MAPALPFILTVVFVLTYAAIALEHPLRINKSATALVGAGVLWTLYHLGGGDVHRLGEQLGESLQGVAQITFFLMGAMTIVEVIDAHNGFVVITARIKTTRLSSLFWLVGIVTFLLSAILDNLTTTIVMLSLLRKLLKQREDRLYFAGFVVIAANAGGAWSPIGDVTTTMLWIGGQLSSLGVMRAGILPALVNLLLPLALGALQLRGRTIDVAPRLGGASMAETTTTERNVMFCLGLGALISVPLLKTVVHLPPFMGVLLGLGVLWLVGDLLHRHKEEEQKQRLTLVRALTRIDMSSLLFFVGILLAVAVLEHVGLLAVLAGRLDQELGRQEVIVAVIGLVSAVVDNVPLVAAAMGMYDLAQYPADSFLWEFLAYCAGTGGSILVIGSAAGVAAMGMEKIDFFWYFKRISGLALTGYLAGAATYLAQRALS